MVLVTTTSENLKVRSVDFELQVPHIDALEFGWRTVLLVFYHFMNDVFCKLSYHAFLDVPLVDS